MINRRFRAQALGFVVVALPMFLAIADWRSDTTLLTLERRSRKAPPSTARPGGATRVDMDLLRASGGSDVQARRGSRAGNGPRIPRSDARLCRRVAQPAALADRRHSDTRPSASWALLHTVFLRVVGMDQVPIAATSDASVEYGASARPCHRRAQ